MIFPMKAPNYFLKFILYPRRKAFLSCGFLLGLLLAYIRLFGLCTQCKNISQMKNQPLRYNLPALLQISSFLSIFSITTQQFTENFNNSSIRNEFPNSIAAHFLQLQHDLCGPGSWRPNAESLRNAFRLYGIQKATEKDFQLFSRNTTLTVQVGKRWDRSLLMSVLRQIPPTLTTEDIVFCISPDASIIPSKKELHSFVEFFFSEHTKTHLFQGGLKGDDAFYYSMAKAAHLAVCDGEEGALAAISNSEGVVYPTSNVKSYLKKDEFRWLVPLYDPLSVVSRLQTRPIMLRTLGAVQPTCCNFESFGKGDEKKSVCTNSVGFNAPECWVLSIGCMNKWKFEEDIFSKTRCKVHVFDCTGNFTVPVHIKSRVFFHKVCIAPESDGEAFMTLADMIKYGSRQSGLSYTRPPHISKIDVEGWEFSSLRAFLRDSSNINYFPHQILVELHTHGNSANLAYKGVPTNLIGKGKKYEDIKALFAEFFNITKKAGYILVHRSDNSFCFHCSEVNLLHKSVFPGKRKQMHGR